MLKVKELPPDDRPREKLLLRGVQSLTDAELIAILLRTGTKGSSVIEIAQKLIAENGNISNLALKSAEALTKTSGIGKDKAATLAAAFEISRRVTHSDRWLTSQKITEPARLAELFIPMLRDELKERFIVVCLNSSNRVIKYETVSVGNLNSSVVHPREVFKVAIDNLAASIILLHNHPSGNPEPSGEDIRITKTLIEAGKIMNVDVLDHLIIAGDAYHSMVEKRII